MGRPWVERHVTAHDGTRLFIRDYPAPDAPHTQPALLCLSGLVRNSKDFRRLAEALAGWRLVCPDYRGRGLSQRAAAESYHPRTYLDDIHQIIAALGLERIVVVGTSLGGILAWALGATQPSVLAGAVINDIGPRIGTAALGQILDYLAHDRPQPDWKTARRHLRAVWRDAPAHTDEDWQELTEATFRPGEDGRLHMDWDPAIAGAARRQPTDEDQLWHLFASLRRLPLLAVRGSRSAILSEETLNDMAHVAPEMVRVTIEGVGHAPHLAEPDALAAIRALLDTVAAREQRFGQ